MSTTTRTKNGRQRPRRAVQLLIWVLFAAAISTGFALSAYRQQAPTPAAASVSTLAGGPSSSVPLAAGAVPPADTPDLRARYCNADHYGVCDSSSVDGLLPAYRWRTALAMPTDVGPLSLSNFTNAEAEGLFVCASSVWWLLLSIVQFAIGMNIVTAAGDQIDSLFSAAANGLGNSGLPAAIVMVVAAMAAMRAMRGKASQGISMIVGAVLVVGTFSFLAASAAPNKTFQVPGGTAKNTVAGSNVGSPAFLATKGNQYVEQLVGDITTGFGASTALTSSVSNGTFVLAGDTDGATCSYYNQRLYSTYDAYSQGTSDAATPLKASSMAMVSFLWQRAIYDNWVNGLYNDPNAGGRIACHQLEKNANIPSTVQYQIVGGSADGNTSPTDGPYKGMAIGPFIPHSDHADGYAYKFAWAACSRPDLKDGKVAVNPGWDVVGAVTPQNCYDWYVYKPSPDDYGVINKGLSDLWSSVGLNKHDGADGRTALHWDSTDEVMQQAVFHDPKGPSADQLNATANTVLSYFGQDSGNRALAGLISLVSAVMYLWVLGAASIGTILSQVGLLVFLCLLPYTLMLLAFPAKDGGRNPMGKRMLRLTGTFFGGKVVFMALMAVTVQLMSVLYTVFASMTGSGSGTSAAGSAGVILAAGGAPAGMYQLASLFVPAATLFVMRTVTKSLGMGNIMSLTGAAGFATSAVLSGKENKKARAGFQGSLEGSLAGRALNRADKFGKSWTTPGGLKKRVKDFSANQKSLSAKQKVRSDAQAAQAALAAGEMSPEIAAKVARGELTMAAAREIESGRLDPSLLSAVRAGNLTPEEALAMSAAMKASRAARGAAEAGEAGADEGATSRTGGYTAAVDRIEGTADHSDGSGAPVFQNTFEAKADAAELRLAQAENRHHLEVATRGMDETQWLDHHVNDALGSLEALRAEAQGAEIGRTLTPSEVTFAKEAYSAKSGIPVDFILMEKGGLPGVLAPLPVDAAGNRVIPNDLPPEVVHMLAANPANVMDLQKRETETMAQYHERVVLTQYMAGAIDVKGDAADLWAAHGIDRETVSGREEMVRVLTGTSTQHKLTDLMITVPDSTRRAIERVVVEHHRTSPVEQLTQSLRSAEVRSLAEAVEGSAQRVQSDIESATSPVLNSSPASPDFARNLDRALRVIEDKVVSTFTDLGAVQMEARATRDTADSVDFSSVLSSAKRFAAAGEQAAAQLSLDISRQAADIKMAQEDDQKAMLDHLTKFVGRALTEAQEAMSEDLSSMATRLADNARTQQQHLGSQISPPPRGIDFAGGATPLPS